MLWLVRKLDDHFLVDQDGAMSPPILLANWVGNQCGLFLYWMQRHKRID
jgi:hypothetical protein